MQILVFRNFYCVIPPDLLVIFLSYDLLRLTKYKNDLLFVHATNHVMVFNSLSNSIRHP